MHYFLTEEGIVTRAGQPLLPERREEVLEKSRGRLAPIVPAPRPPQQICRHCFRPRDEKHAEPCRSYDPRAAHSQSISNLKTEALKTHLILAVCLILGFFVMLGGFYLAANVGKEVKTVRSEKVR